MALDLAGRIGVRFLRLSVGIGIGGLFIYKTIPHAFPVTICQNVLGNSEEDVPEKCRSEFVKRAHEMGLENSEKVSMFVNKGFSGFSAGSTSFPNGAVVGIPGWYLFDNDEDVMKSPINFKGRSIKWHSEMGTQMKEALTPTQDNIAFTIGHEIAHLQLPEYKLLYAVLPSTWLYVTYKAVTLTSKFSKIPFLIDVILKLCLLRISYLGYKYVNTEVHHKEEFAADEASAKVDLQAARGGVDVMKKRLQLNKVLRALHGSNGLAHYDEYGNERKTFHPKLSERMERLQTILDEHTRKSI